MRHFLFFIILFFFTFPLFADEINLDQYVAPHHVIIVGSYKEFEQAKQHVKELSQKLKLPYYTRGLVFDKAKGLIWPEGSDDVWAGSYLARRYNDDCGKGISHCLTIERSDGYEGFVKGYYILVAGIYAVENKELDQQMNQIKKIIPDAYAKKTRIYMGCIH